MSSSIESARCHSALASQLAIAALKITLFDRMLATCNTSEQSQQADSRASLETSEELERPFPSTCATTACHGHTSGRQALSRIEKWKPARPNHTVNATCLTLRVQGPYATASSAHWSVSSSEQQLQARVIAKCFSLHGASVTSVIQ